MTNNNKYININGCLTQEGIVYFLRNKEDNAHHTKIEEHLKVCELCRNAVLGYKKLNNLQKIEAANDLLKERFSKSISNKKSKLIPTHMLINLVTVAAVIMIALVIVKNFTNINYQSEEALYTEELSLLNKKDFTRPSPPQRTKQKIIYNSNKKTTTKHRVDEVKNEKIVIPEQQNIAANISSKKINDNLTDYSDKKLVDKSYTEFQITLPVEVDRRGYSYHDNNIVTASYEKGVALSSMPSFKGKGLEGFVEYVSNNIRYPEEAKEHRLTGVVEIQFAVDVDGKVKDIEIKKGINPILDREAYRLIKNSPKWIPGFVKGRPTKIYLRFPVSFRIE